MSIAGDIIAGVALAVSSGSVWYAHRANNRADSFSTVPVLLVADNQMLRLRNTGEQNVIDVHVDYGGKRSYVPVLIPGGHVDVCSAFSFLADGPLESTALKPITCEYPAGVGWEIILERMGPEHDEPKTVRRRLARVQREGRP